MSLPGISVRRPVTIIMFFTGIILLGIISLQRIPQELFPPITYPQLTIVTSYKDAAPEEIEVLITKPIEEAVGTVSGLKKISSVSKEEMSLVIAEFNWGIDMDFAALGVREKIDLVKGILPRGCDDPIVVKFNPFELPVIILNVTGPYSSYDLLEMSRKIIKGELEKIEGVASAGLSGGREREIVVEVDQGRLHATNTSIVNISDALKKANLNYPAGTIKEEFYEYLIRTMGEFETVDEIRRLPVSADETLIEQEERERKASEEESEEKDRRIGVGRLVYMSDIANVKDTVKEKTSISRYNNKDTISVSVQKKAGGNTVKVASDIKNAIKNQVKIALPKDVRMNIVYDQSVFVKDAITGVTDAAVQGGLLSLIVLFLFLKNMTASLIVTLTIPISILATFSFMYFQGITLNMISMGGLALGVGMLIDTSIVVIENIFRHVQLGKSPAEGSVYGATEVSGAVTGSTLTSIAVFLPMIFVVGIAGQVFKELAFTITISTLAALALTITLVPTLTSKMKKGFKISQATTEEELAESGKTTQRGLVAILDKILKTFLRHRVLGLFLIFVMFAFSIKVFAGLNKEFMPKIDQGQFVIKLEMPPGTRLEATDAVVKKIENLLLSYDELSDLTINIGSSKEKEAGQALDMLDSHQARLIVNLKPLYISMFSKRPPAAKADKYRAISTSDLVSRLRDDLKSENMEGAQIEYLLQESVFASAFQQTAPLIVEIKGQDLGKLKDLTDEITGVLYNIKGVYGIRDSIIPPSPEVKVHIVKDRATSYSLSVSDIAITAQTAMKGFVATKFKDKGREVDVRVVLRPQDRKDMAKIRRLLVHSPLDIEVPLGEVAYFNVGRGPTEIKRQDQQRVVVVSANLQGRTLDEVAQEVETAIKQMNVPSGYNIMVTGETIQMKESFTSLQFALILSIVLVYMIMAAQFESLWQPFIIMFTIPLSLIGVTWALFITGISLNVMAVLGIIVLGGVVVNNGIVLIDFINTLIREAKFSPYEAAVKASEIRLRPILMTAATSVLGLVPLALGLSEGAQLQQPMAVAIMGGITLSTFLSLVVIPTIYLIGEDFFSRLNKIFGRKKKETAVLVEERPQQEIAQKPKEAPPEKPRELPQQKITQGHEEEIESVGLPQKIKKEEIKIDTQKSTEAPNLNYRQLALIEYLKEKGHITRFEYAKLFNASIPTASRDLKELLKKGIVVGVGPLARGRFYQLSEDFKKRQQII